MACQLFAINGKFESKYHLDLFFKPQDPKEFTFSQQWLVNQIKITQNIFLRLKI